MSEQRPDYDAQTIQRELQQLLAKHGVQLLPVVVSPSGATVPVGDFVPDRWRVEIRIIEAN
jgi:hypothetical protein